METPYVRRAEPDELRLAASHLEELADAAQAYVVDESVLVADGSVAAEERADSRYDGKWGLGSEMVCIEVVPRVAAIADHLRGLAALTGTPGVSLSISSLVRPTLEALATLSWLYEDGIGGRERIRRRFNLRLVSLAQEENLANMLGKSDGRFQRTIDDIATGADNHGFRFNAPTTTKRGIVHPGRLGPPVPTGEALITRLAAPASQTIDVGGLVYRRTSAVVHGQMHGFHPFLLSDTPSTVPGALRAEFGLPFAWFCILTSSVLGALNASMWRVLEHYGRNPDDWADVSQAAIDQWVAWLAETNTFESTSDPRH
ncbi:hypothetical protein [Cellulomonas terrae]|uniref:hypothetical protein n=1 Tax=Cellulomonas terrae TaxID=311234 RepID=UPI000B0E86BF|nr:hypothetical protein [Cellulomonas terrae]